MLLFWKLVDGTQISKPLEPTMNHNLIKWLILLPLRAELRFTLQYQIPCTWIIIQCCLEYFEINFSAPLGIFSDCNNQWCLQQGLNKPQHTKCESVTNNGDTCINPQIKYGSVEGGIPQGKPYDKWCNQLGGVYDSFTKGSRTGYCVMGSKGFDDNVWHWADCSDGYWYNATLDRYEVNDRYITSITCKGTDYVNQITITIILLAQCIIYMPPWLYFLICISITELSGIFHILIGKFAYINFWNTTVFIMISYHKMFQKGIL